MVVDHDDGELEVLADLEQEVAEGVGLLGAEARSGLVEQQQVGVGGEHGRDLEPLLDAVGQALDAGVEEVVEAHEVEDGVGPFGGVLLGLERGRRTEHAGEGAVADLEVLGRLEVLAGGRALDQTDVLERAAHAAVGPVEHLELGDVLAAVADPARGGGVEAGDAVEQRRLARPVGADDADDLVLVDPQVDVAQRLHAAEADRHVVGLQHGGALAGGGLRHGRH